MRRHQEAAFRGAFLVLRDAAEAEDAMQEALMKAYRALGRFQAGRAFRPWLLRIVFHEALNRRKAMQRRAAMTERAARQDRPPLPAVDDEVQEREQARALWSALETLGERERTVLYLHYFLSLPERETAEYLGCAVGTVKSRVHRAVRKLREVVTRRHPELLGERT